MSLVKLSGQRLSQTGLYGALFQVGSNVTAGDGILSTSVTEVLMIVLLAHHLQNDL